MAPLLLSWQEGLGVEMLYVKPLTLAQANAFISHLHRHHKKVQGHRFSLAAYDNYTLVGVATVGRPVSSGCPQYDVAEVTRLCTDGTKNACSILYSACARACKEMGYCRIQTYILETESGTSLKASGWFCEGAAGGRSWTTKTRKRSADMDGEPKTRWCKVLQEL